MRRLACVLIAAGIALSGCTDPYNNQRPPAERRIAAPQPPSAALTPYVQDGPDAGDRAQVRRSRARPAFQELPYRTAHVLIDYVDERAGRIVLLVSYIGSRARALARYRRFLARFGDRPGNYIVRLRAVAQP